MFLQNMTSDELVREYKKDLPEIRRLSLEFDNSSYISRILQKNRKSKRVWSSRLFTTSRNNTYLNVFTYRKDESASKRLYKWNYTVNSIGIMQSFKGLCYIIFFDESTIAVKFQSHFFLRYRQRIADECDWKTRARLSEAATLNDIVAVYVSRNTDTSLIKTDIKYIDKEHIFAPVNDGAMLLQWNGKNIQANTFITKSMFSCQQKCMSDQAENEKERGKLVHDATEVFMKLMEDDNWLWDTSQIEGS